MPEEKKDIIYLHRHPDYDLEFTFSGISITSKPTTIVLSSPNLKIGDSDTAYGTVIDHGWEGVEKTFYTEREAISELLWDKVWFTMFKDAIDGEVLEAKSVVEYEHSREKPSITRPLYNKHGGNKSRLEQHRVTSTKATKKRERQNKKVGRH